MIFSPFLVNSSKDINGFNPFKPSAPVLDPQKTSENRKVGFLMFSGGGERVHWERMVPEIFLHLGYIFSPFAGKLSAF